LERAAVQKALKGQKTVGRYYKPCKELDECDRLIEEYFKSGQYEKCFQGHLRLAEQGYPLAECQIGYFYLEGLGVPKDAEKSFYWTKRAAEHGDWDGQFNLGEAYETGTGTEKDLEQAKRWYREAAGQGHELALEKCKKLKIEL